MRLVHTPERAEIRVIQQAEMMGVSGGFDDPRAQMLPDPDPRDQFRILAAKHAYVEKPL